MVGTGTKYFTVSSSNQRFIIGISFTSTTLAVNSLPCKASLSDLFAVAFFNVQLPDTFLSHRSILSTGSGLVSTIASKIFVSNFS